MDSTINIFGLAEPLFANEPRYLRVKRALAVIGISKTTLYALIKARRVRAVKLRGMTFVDLQSFEELFRECPEIVPQKYAGKRMISAAALGLEEAPDVAAPRDPDGPLPSFGLTAADLAALAGPESEEATPGQPQ